MRISDWSSDVCSSDLRDRQGFWAKRASLANRGDAAPKPLFPRHVETRRPWDMRWYKYHAQREHADNLLSIVRTLDDQMNRSEERRVGKEGVSTGRFRWSPAH